MSKEVNILRLISLFLVLLALLGTVTAKIGHIRKVETKSTTAAKHTKEQKDHQQEIIVEAASFEAIVSFVHFNLSQDFYFNFVPTFSKLLLFLQHSLEEPVHITSYFKNTFCHHIAINAP
jgi:hypothetical protein